MGLYIQDSDGAFYVKDGMAIHDNRGHKEIMKQFRSDAEAEEYLLRLMGIDLPKRNSPVTPEMNGKHKKSHRRRKPK